MFKTKRQRATYIGIFSILFIVGLSSIRPEIGSVSTVAIGAIGTMVAGYIASQGVSDTWGKDNPNRRTDEQEA